LAGAGNLELNSFLPLIAHLFLKSMEMLRDVNYNLAQKCISGITVNVERCRQNLLNSTATAASLITKFGYDKIAEVVKYSETKKIPFITALKEKRILNDKELLEFLLKQIGVINEQRS
jgi:aspartate ammonia-lyase